MTQPIGESYLEKTLENESDTATDRSMELSAVLARAQSGDQRAFETLYRATVDKVYGLCLRMTANPAMAEDCVQQTYIQAWRNLARFRGGS
ncbi:MAG: sigma factor, partial [Pseudomonadales bacterium]